MLTPSVATMLAEGRSAGLEAVFAWQYTAQIRDEIVRSGVRSLLQSISIFRMREMEDARSLAGLAMDVYSDRISVDHEDQERLRFSADDITRLAIHHAINLWVADGTPRPGFVAHTLPMGGAPRPSSSPTITATPSASAAATAPPTCPTRSATAATARHQSATGASAVACRAASRPATGGATWAPPATARDERICPARPRRLQRPRGAR